MERKGDCHIVAKLLHFLSSYYDQSYLFLQFEVNMVNKLENFKNQTTHGRLQKKETQQQNIVEYQVYPKKRQQTKRYPENVLGLLRFIRNLHEH